MVFRYFPKLALKQSVQAYSGTKNKETQRQKKEARLQGKSREEVRKIETYPSPVRYYRDFRVEAAGSGLFWPGLLSVLKRVLKRPRRERNSRRGSSIQGSRFAQLKINELLARYI